MSLLKNGLGALAIEQQVAALTAVMPTFDGKGYTKDALHGLQGLELKQRVGHMIQCLHKRLPPKFEDAAPILARTASISGNGKGIVGFAAWPLIDYVAAYGLDRPDIAVPLLRTLTPLMSAEFAIRPFVLKHFDMTYAAALQWCDDENEHVRRLASEGLRPRLPWGLRINAFCQDPTPLVPILNKLRDDPSLYVRKSVANSLNDISKDNPAIVVHICQEWMKGRDATVVIGGKNDNGVVTNTTTVTATKHKKSAPKRPREGESNDASSQHASDHIGKVCSANTLWIVKHGTRTLVKNGCPDTLQLFGVKAHTDDIACEGLTLSAVKAAQGDKKAARKGKGAPAAGTAQPQIAMGDSVAFTFSLKNVSTDTPHDLIIDYAISYPRKAKGAAKSNKKKPQYDEDGKEASDSDAEEPSVTAGRATFLRKVFKLTTVKGLAPLGTTNSLSATVSFRPLTTRKYYAGQHKLEVLVNGKVVGSKTFLLRE